MTVDHQKDNPAIQTNIFPLPAFLYIR